MSTTSLPKGPTGTLPATGCCGSTSCAAWCSKAPRGRPGKGLERAPVRGNGRCGGGRRRWESAGRGSGTFGRVEPDGTRTPGPRIIAQGVAARTNDGATDPFGRFLVGTLSLGREANRECLYRVDIDGSLFAIDTDLSLSNGLGWSSDGRTFYSVDTLAGIVWKREYSDPLGSRERFLSIDRGYPDGICIDAAGQPLGGRLGLSRGEEVLAQGRADGCRPHLRPAHVERSFCWPAPGPTAHHLGSPTPGRPAARRVSRFGIAVPCRRRGGRCSGDSLERPEDLTEAPSGAAGIPCDYAWRAACSESTSTTRSWSSNWVRPETPRIPTIDPRTRMGNAPP